MRHNRQRFTFVSSVGRRGLVGLAVVFTLVTSDFSIARAGGRRPRLASPASESVRASGSGPLVVRVSPQLNNAPAVVRPAPGSAYSGRYPKFQGGFHSRELQNIGVPTGDIGLRGNGFSAFPW